MIWTKPPWWHVPCYICSSSRVYGIWKLSQVIQSALFIPSWRSLNPLIRSLNHHKKVTDWITWSLSFLKKTILWSKSRGFQLVTTWLTLRIQACPFRKGLHRLNPILGMGCFDHQSCDFSGQVWILSDLVIPENWRLGYPQEMMGALFPRNLRISNNGTFWVSIPIGSMYGIFTPTWMSRWKLANGW